MNMVTMNSRERVTRALNHHEPDRVPFDQGGSSVTGMHVSTIYRLRQALGLDPPGTPVKVTRPYLILTARRCSSPGALTPIPSRTATS
jgi:hypothetical protein